MVLLNTLIFRKYTQEIYTRENDNNYCLPNFEMILVKIKI
jgi:hypothetical protein